MRAFHAGIFAALWLFVGLAAAAEQANPPSEMEQLKAQVQTLIADRQKQDAEIRALRERLGRLEAAPQPPPSPAVPAAEPPPHRPAARCVGTRPPPAR